MRASRPLPIAALVLVLLSSAGPALAADDGTMTIGLHVTLVSRWLDPAETEALITPFMVLYALHDALVKPMPAGIMTPSLAESWTVSKDGISYEFLLRKGARFHNGDPLTADDVKFSFERYKGSGAALLKDKVKDVQVVAPNRVRFVLKEPWPDFLAFYGTSATGAAWIVPKKYIEKVGEDGFKKAPVGAGPYKLVSFTPGIELVVEAFPDYWRKAPSVKRIVMRSIPDESTRAAAVKTGEVDIAYLFGGAIAGDLRGTPGIKVVAPLVYGVYWLDFLDQWNPKSPWHDQRVRMAAGLAIDRKALNQAEMLGMGRLTGSFVPPTFDFALKLEPPGYDPKRAKQLMVEAGYPNGFDAGDLTGDTIYGVAIGEPVANYLQQIGIRVRLRPMERVAFFKEYGEKKLRGVIFSGSGAPGNAPTRLEQYAVTGGRYSYGSYPDVDGLYTEQVNEMNPRVRQQILYKIQRLIHEKVMFGPVIEPAFLNGVGPRLEVHGLGLVANHAYSAPYEDLRLKKP
jgi:peptide/nickel transport system substrate-binding protein